MPLPATVPHGRPGVPGVPAATVGGADSDVIIMPRHHLTSSHLTSRSCRHVVTEVAMTTWTRVYYNNCLSFLLNLPAVLLAQLGAPRGEIVSRHAGDSGGLA